MASCDRCEQTHVVADGHASCTGHVTRERADENGYRAPLPEPRPCANRPMAGQRVCHAHGGRSPQARASSRQRQAAEAIEADARKLLAYSGTEPIEDPVAVINEMLAMAYALTHAAAAHVNSLDEIRYTGGLERDERGELRGTGTEQIRAEVPLLERSIDRTARLAEMVVKHTGNRDVDDTKAMLAKLGEALGVGTQ